MMNCKRALLGVLLMGPCAWVATSLGEPSAPSVVRDEVRPIQVFVVRHAEKAADDPRDPTLSARGVTRAEKLSELLRWSGVTHLFASEYRRTQLTLKPLADRCGREVEQISAGDLVGLVERIGKLEEGNVAVVAGHSNTVPAIVEALGGTIERVERTARGPMLRDDEYDRVFLVTLAPREADGEPQLRGVMELKLDL